MGLTSASTASGSSTPEGMQMCIFDLRRGQNEGQELDKILFFYPADLPFSAQFSLIGLSEGLITFTRYGYITFPLHPFLIIFGFLIRRIPSNFVQNFLSRCCLWGNWSRQAFSCFLWARTRYLDGHGNLSFLRDASFRIIKLVAVVLNHCFIRCGGR